MADLGFEAQERGVWWEPTQNHPCPLSSQGKVSVCLNVLTAVQRLWVSPEHSKRPGPHPGCCPMSPWAGCLRALETYIPVGADSQAFTCPATCQPQRPARLLDHPEPLPDEAATEEVGGGALLPPLQGFSTADPL